MRDCLILCAGVFVCEWAHGGSRAGAQGLPLAGA